MEQCRRDAIIELYHAGHNPKDIIKLLKYPKSTVYDVIKRFNGKGDYKRKNHKPRSDKIRTPTFLAGLKKSIRANPGMPMRKLARDRNVCPATISKAVRTSDTRATN